MQLIICPSPSIFVVWVLLLSSITRLGRLLVLLLALPVLSFSRCQCLSLCTHPVNCVCACVVRVRNVSVSIYSYCPCRFSRPSRRKKGSFSGACVFLDFLSAPCVDWPPIISLPYVTASPGKGQWPPRPLLSCLASVLPLPSCLPFFPDVLICLSCCMSPPFSGSIPSVSFEPL